MKTESYPKPAFSPAIGEFAVTELQKARELNAELLAALIAAERYMSRQRARSNAPFDPEALKQARAVIARLEKEKS